MGAPFVVGVAGGTASGKTTVAERLSELLQSGCLALMKLDAYYRHRPELTFEQRTKINYDHPDAFDWDLLRAHLDALCAGEAIEMPVYDYAAHLRSDQVTRLYPTSIVVVEGILVLWDQPLRERFDLRVYVDADPDVRFIRRLSRDVSDRGRTPDSVIDQYLGTVRPSHLQFIEPSKRYADVIIPNGGHNEPALQMLRARMTELLAQG